jgi:hypothetical protein
MNDRRMTGFLAALNVSRTSTSATMMRQTRPEGQVREAHRVRFRARKTGHRRLRTIALSARASQNAVLPQRFHRGVSAFRSHGISKGTLRGWSSSRAGENRFLLAYVPKDT